MLVCRKPITNIGDSTCRCYLQVNKHMQLPCCVILDQQLQKNGFFKPFPKVNLYHSPVLIQHLSSSNSRYPWLMRISLWLKTVMVMFTGLPAMALENRGLGTSPEQNHAGNLCTRIWRIRHNIYMQCRWKKGCIYRNKNTCTHQFHW